MFTLFDLLRVLATLMGAAVGGWLGDSLFGMAGSILGALVGGVSGSFVGALPFFLAARSLRRELQRADSASLGRRLQEQYFISHLILAELDARSEDLARFEESILALMQSESSDRRRHGWASLRSFYPARAQALANYDSAASVEACRQQVASLIERPAE
ncbi:hypothetical protein MYSTI_01580 [Myxococcus stipitatus DSM 14675]|uniref:Uncharacterized protein n=1 Tax=Myxococcus stipitatus (strain DSM 14675 / JCM 12634 / Mx s8) TaxID=1278073 RepID=L7U438_MYXSD|nr:hypothetical protein [Myxococcus stipitatus]AGC42913.1 hypothetical protein MYSTI_01580 [Myxococcus stipitatus DSM 14675]